MADILEYQASDAQAKWEQLLDEVERGRTVRIALDGKTIARLVPEPEIRKAEVAAAIAARFTRKSRQKSRAEILASRHEGHKY
jgi:antitoxin (DNA-binding transcriptional repressor) of toxin-antitoxin stability system